MKFSILVLSTLLLFASQSSAQDAPDKVRVFVLAGQSNMQGHGVVDLDDPEKYNSGKGTLKYLLNQPADAGAKSSQMFARLRSDEEWTVRDDVWIRYKTNHGIKRGPLTVGFSGYEGQHHIGPELQFGHVVGEYFEEPVLLIKTAWGGKSLFKDFRPPSAVAARGGKVGPFYQKMMAEVAEALEQAPADFPELKELKELSDQNNLQFEISGFVWQQGWNDMIDENARNEYFANLTALIDDVRIAWGKPGLPVVVGELGNGGKENTGDSMQHFRREQSRIDAHPPFAGNVTFVPTTQHARPASESPNVGHGHHWFGNAESYLLVGDSLGHEMVSLIEQSGLPRVLILGDSISIGYMPRVKRELAKSSLVVRPMSTHWHAENCQGTRHGVKRIDHWLAIGGGKWDVIHFNFGLHDLKHVDSETGKNSNDPAMPEQSPPELYESQLREIVGKLGATGAKLIFATTTPVPEGGVKPYRDTAAPQQYNDIARRIMEEKEIEINDLYTLANERLSEIQRPVDVHFTPQGSRLLAEQVMARIARALD